jgi:hypothetical protein
LKCRSNLGVSRELATAGLCETLQNVRKVRGIDVFRLAFARSGKI